MKKILALCFATAFVLACGKKPTPAPEPTPSPAPTASPTAVVPAETPIHDECVNGEREVTAVGGGSTMHINCRECVDGKWKPCKD